MPAALFDPERHAVRVTTVEENRDNLRAISALVAAPRPDARVILALSPIPPMATFGPMSCLAANAVSKAVLRLAIDQVMSEGRRNLFDVPATRW